jgi:hypothetical protein
VNGDGVFRKSWGPVGLWLAEDWDEECLVGWSRKPGITGVIEVVFGLVANKG